MGIDIVTQKGVSLKIEDKWAKKGYRLDRLIAKEHISRPFEYELTLTADATEGDFKELMGKTLGAQFDFDAKTSRYFEGIVGWMRQDGTISDTELTIYTLKLYPKLWMLGFNKKYKIFQNKNAITIIKDIFKEQKLNKFRDETKSRGKTSRVYCVQYEESDLDFVQRLMEEEGIFYFFEQTKEGHNLVLADTPTCHKNFNETGNVDVANNIPQPGFLDALFACSYQQHIIPKTYSLQDYNFTTPKTDLKGEAKGQGLGDTIFEYPGQTGFEENPQKDVNKALADLHLTADEATQERLEGKSGFPKFFAGSNFTLKNHPRKDLNKKYTLLWVEHHIETHIDPSAIEAQLIYHNTFGAFPATKTYRPPRQHTKKRILSTQTATVVGPLTKEIHTDKYGRIKIMFHWDPERKKDQNCSCWVRTAQNWSDKSWGFVFIPRINQEVVVTFLNGDPDRPLVTGCVYNGDKTPPYLPGTPTKSTIKTSSVGVPKGKPVGFNELRFEDKYQSEEIYIHAQKDWNTHVIESRETTIEKGSDTKIIERGDRSVTLKGLDRPVKGKGNDALTIEKGSRTTTLLAKGTDKGNYTIEMKRGDRSLSIDEGNQTLTLKKGNRTVTLNMGDETVTLKNGNQTILINAGTRTISVMKDETHKNNANYKHTVIQNYTLQVTGNVEVKATGGIKIQSAQSIDFQAPKIAFKAAAKFEVNCGGMVDLKSGGPMQIQSGAALMAKSGAAIQIQSGAALMLQSGAMAMLKATAVCMSQGALQVQNSQGPFTIKGMPILMT